MKLIPVTARELKIFELLGGTVLMQQFSSARPVYSISNEPGLSEYRDDKTLVGAWQHDYEHMYHEDITKMTTFHTHTNSLIQRGKNPHRHWILVCP